MPFMMLVKADRDYEAGKPPKPELMAAIGKLGEEAAKAGALLDMGGLLPSAMGARGYAILRAGSKEEAIELGKGFMKLHAHVLGPAYEGQLEIRQLADPPDA